MDAQNENKEKSMTEEKSHLVWFQTKLLATNGESNVGHGVKTAAVYR
jgi:hypothetical protein